MRKKVLLLDTNFSAVPIYNYLVDSGYTVCTMGNRKTEALAGMKNWIECDYSKVDDVANKILTHDVNYIVPGVTDVSYKTAAKIGRSVIDSEYNALYFTNKFLFQNYAKDAGLPVPKPSNPSKSACIVKPVDSFSGNGMSLLLPYQITRKAIEKAKKASKVGEYIMEEYVDGQLYSHSAFVIGGQIKSDFIVREDCVMNPFTVDLSFVEWDFPKKYLKHIRSAIQMMVADLGLVDGLIHTQFIFDGTQWWIIEITRRMPGDLYSDLIEKSTGYPYASMYAINYLGKGLPIFYRDEKHWIVRHTIKTRAGRVVIFCERETKAAMMTLYNKIKSRMFYQVEG